MSSALFWVQQKVLTLVRRKYSSNRVTLYLPIVKPPLLRWQNAVCDESRSHGVGSL